VAFIAQRLQIRIIVRSTIGKCNDVIRCRGKRCTGRLLARAPLAQGVSDQPSLAPLYPSPAS